MDREPDLDHPGRECPVRKDRKLSHVHMDEWAEAETGNEQPGVFEL